MKSYLIVFALLCLAVATVPAGAVELQEGWYAQFDYVDLVENYIDEHGDPVSWSVQWFPASATGQFDSTLVQGNGPAGRYGRNISITGDVTVSPGVLFEDTGTYATGYPYFDQVAIGWSTSYDANVMQLQLFRHRTGESDVLFWAQTLSGAQYGYGSIQAPRILPGDDIVLRVVAIPEPSSLIVFLCGSALSITAIRRRRCAAR